MFIRRPLHNHHPEELCPPWQQPEPWFQENPQGIQPRPPQQPYGQLEPPIEPLDDNEDLPPYHEDDDDNPGEVRPEIPGLNGIAGQNFPVSLMQAGRRSYHALPRENAEALNILLTRDLPVLSNQMQSAIEQTHTAAIEMENQP
ncbi:uncharacterized protein LOC114541033 [Dendronephthya gigantea]|uniref:uncharacterized protein LOC114541033 n=1 Tax=Dendronephthya gigantea TaxID=151771 RepID=UPI00106C16AD|nr:uncharacterized protein LOC114541033 [Dendronephthya gigantea]